ncbi:MAG: TonB-dependent receptor [Deltaproteobacteria bacterium]
MCTLLGEARGETPAPDAGDVPASAAPPDPTAGTPAPSDSAPATPAPNIVPPRLGATPEIPYPATGTGDAIVLLTLTVNADGSVRSASAAQGEEPFASAAVQAATGLRFEPATRDGRPVAATIRFEITFRAPLPQPAPSPAGESPGNTVASRPAAEPTKPIEVTVRGQTLAPAVSSFSRAEVRQLPGAFGDPFRAIEALPGVTPIASGLPFFYVRGAPPGNVGYFLDGVRVPYLYHVGLGPSIVHPGMVERVDLYPGGYPPRFGRFAGGIVSGETSAPEPELHGEANVRLFDAGLLAETGFADGRGSLLLGGRYSYTAALVSLLAPDTDLAYRDYQLRLSYALTPDDQITAFGFGSYDLVAQTQNGIYTIVFGSEFYRLDLRYDHTFRGQGRLRSAVTLGFDQTRIADQRNAQGRMLALRTELDQPLHPRLTLHAGADATLDAFGADARTYADPEDPDTLEFNNLFPPRTDLAFGAWADVVWKPTPRLEITPGVRADLFASGGTTAVGVDPRIAARFEITKALRIVHAYGLAHQPPSFIVPIPGLTPGKLQGGLQTSLQTSAGLEVDLFEGTTATATLFHSAFFDMNDALGIPESTATGDALNQRALGSAAGFELFVRRRLTQKIGGYLSYTLSRSTRAVGGYSFPSAFDRTHVGSTALAYDLGRRWRAGARFVFYTGIPKTTPSPGLITPPPAEHPERDPAFYRLDVRLEKRWQLGERTWISFVAEVLNTTLQKETFGDNEIGPVTIPSVGVEAGF